ncbi:toxin-antitoxin system PIN domain toxin [Prosthecobacter fusiformis]|uniref:Ribonuclease VapC n=1 Tax=Prosthecobacter fusiformis TaxID=48464 RepID=A0A4V3FE87_9BACT|nr:TA system VapC family ribonuclease toxin [Prosthecobacter fusiformis]TDU66063.1 toxin-antitoxin system PIN domain toxin [Prosthecobacter fusiformis]
MLSFDTNLAVHAANSASPFHAKAADFIKSLVTRKDVAICELVLVELYLKLRNEKIFSRPLSAEKAAAVCQSYRKNRAWLLIESAPVMDDVWQQAAGSQFAFRRIIDLRLALTLRHHGVTEFATANEKDFQNLGFSRIWNPLTA